MHHYINMLIADCEAAKQAKARRTFVGVGRYGRHDSVTPDLSQLRTYESAIYVIEQIGGEPKKTFDALKDYKAQGQRSCPKLNAESPVLYVGSSIGNVGQRLSQHIGPTNMLKTYALHLNCWFDGEYKITVEEFDVPPTVLQILEDAKSHHLKPAFGKMGGNNGG